LKKKKRAALASLGSLTGVVTRISLLKRRGSVVREGKKETRM